MIATLIIDKEGEGLTHLLSRIANLLPGVKVKGSTACGKEYEKLVTEHQPNLIFINPQVFEKMDAQQRIFEDPKKAFICVSDNFDYARKPCFWEAVGYLNHPLVDKELVLAVEKAKLALKTKQENHQGHHLTRKDQRLIGIPTMEGFEIILVDEIIRCEGLQKCTRIVTQQKTDIISSYNIGAFKKLLQPYDLFFCPHRSHLINLLWVQKFKKAGAISLKNGTDIPMAKNRKDEFLQRINHF